MENPYDFSDQGVSGPPVESLDASVLWRAVRVVAWATGLLSALAVLASVGLWGIAILVPAVPAGVSALREWLEGRRATRSGVPDYVPDWLGDA